MENIRTIKCPALFIAGSASGQGKTSVTAALARYHRRLDRVVRVFKMGPDYLDPQILEQAAGSPVEQLDMWMMGEDYCRQMLFEAAQEADLILIEGAMGLFDGEPSSADLSVCFNIPIVIVLDVKGMAQTAAVIMTGLVNFRSDISVVGLIANNCGSERHAELIKDALPDNVSILATLKRDSSFKLPERHLGLVQASEVEDELESVFETLADILSDTELSKVPIQVEFNSIKIATINKTLSGFKLGIAKDAAFSFIYSANLKLLRAMGAELFFFSPLHDVDLPEVDGLWLPGGYPELHAEQLSKNKRMCQQIKTFFKRDKPILAECGGFLYCLENLQDLEGQLHAMLGLLRGQGAMTGRQGCQGMQIALLPEGEVRAHAHHHAQSNDMCRPNSFARRQRHSAPGEAIYRDRGLTASFLHLFFASNADAISRLFLSEIASAQIHDEVGIAY